MNLQQQIAMEVSRQLGGLVVPNLVKKRYTLFDHRVIKDTKIYFPDVLMDLSLGIAWGFDIDNAQDQTVTVELIGGGDPSSMGLVGSSGSVAAGTIQPLATNIWLPFLGVRISYASAPSAGNITVTGWVQERQS